MSCLDTSGNDGQREGEGCIVSKASESQQIMADTILIPIPYCMHHFIPNHIANSLGSRKRHGSNVTCRRTNSHLLDISQSHRQQCKSRQQWLYGQQYKPECEKPCSLHFVHGPPPGLHCWHNRHFRMTYVGVLCTMSSCTTHVLSLEKDL